MIVSDIINAMREMTSENVHEVCVSAYKELLTRREDADEELHQKQEEREELNRLMSDVIDTCESPEIETEIRTTAQKKPAKK